MADPEMLDYLRQVQRQQRIEEYIASIKNPGDEVVAITIDQNDVAILAAAIGSCTPKQVAHWFCEVLNAQTAYFDGDERFYFAEDDTWRSEGGA
jgi:hypothetical protein